MRILVPIDGSDCSERALEFAIEMARRYDAEMHVVHFTDEETGAARQVIEGATETVGAATVDDDPELVSHRELDIRTATRVGKEILLYVDEHGYDHVVMGHHGSGTVERAILGSAAEVVVRAETVPVTVVP